MNEETKKYIDDRFDALKEYIDARLDSYDVAAQNNIQEILNLVPRIVLDTIMAHADITNN